MTGEGRPHLASLVEDFRRHADQIAVVSHTGVRRHTTTYRTLADTAGRFAAELERRGIHKGDRVLLWGENSASWLAAFFGCLMRGIVAVPLDNAGSPEFARRVAADTGAKLACTGHHRNLDIPTVPLDALPLADRPAPILETIQETDPFQIVFTSGTTAEPKGVVHTHRNVLASLRPIETEVQKYLKYERIFHPLRFLHTLPLSHVFGQFMGIWIPALMAAEVHFESRLVASELVPAIHEARISVVACVPRVLDLLRSHLLAKIPGLAGRLERGRTASAWKRWWLFRDVHAQFGLKFWAFVCGGATLPADLEQFWTGLGFVVIQGYGMTETAALVSLNHPFHAARETIGKVLPGREIRLTPEGEILVRGETVASSMWESGAMHARDSEWLATGDLASVDEEGNLRYRGRKKEMIVTSSGLNIYPEDLEAALQKQPEVRACTIIEAEGRSGPEPLAVLVLRGGADPGSVVDAANRGLAEYQHMRRWVVWPEPDLPRNSAGKVLRREVTRQIGGQTHAGALPAMLQRITGQSLESFTDDTALDLDSLARVELQTSLETQFGVLMNDADWVGIRTVGQLRGLLQQQPEAAQVRRTAAATEEHSFPTWPWNPLQTAIRAAFVEMIVRPLVWLLAAPRVQSQLHTVPSSRVLIVANHITAYDAALVLYALPGPMRRRTAVAMAGELLLDLRKGRGMGNWFVNLVSPIGYWLITALFNVFPLPQLSRFRRAFDHAGRAMDAGFHVIVFPEGRRTTDTAMHGFQTGAGLLWKDLGSPALPVYLGGIAELKATGARWFRSRKIEVRVGALLELPPDRDARELSEQLERAVAGLANP